MGIACLLPLVLFLFVGKPYHAVGTVPIALAQGLMAVPSVKRPRLRIGFQIAVLVACIAWICSSATLVGHLRVPYGVQAIEEGAPVTFCVLKAPIQQD